MKVTEVFTAPLTFKGLTGTIAEDAAGFGNKEKSNKDFEREARQKSMWHKEQARKYANKSDADSVAAHKAHDDAWFEYSKIAQEYMYNNTTIATRMAKQLKDKLDKAKISSGDAER